MNTETKQVGHTPGEVYFDLTQDGETIRVYDREGSCMTDYESSKEPLETETFFDWCKNSYSYEVLTKQGHTPGEWSFDGIEVILSKNGEVIADIRSCNHEGEEIENQVYNRNKEEAEANARLIVSAVNNTAGKGINPEAVPDLLEALKNIVNMDGLRNFKRADAIRKAKAAINKATKQ